MVSEFWLHLCHLPWVSQNAASTLTMALFLLVFSSSETQSISDRSIYFNQCPFTCWIRLIWCPLSTSAFEKASNKINFSCQQEASTGSLPLSRHRCTFLLFPSLLSCIVPTSTISYPFETMLLPSKKSLSILWRVAQDLRICFVLLNSRLLGRPSVWIPSAVSSFPHARPCSFLLRISIALLIYFDLA